MTLQEKFGILASVVIVLVCGFVLVAPTAWIQKLLGGTKKDD